MILFYKLLVSYIYKDFAKINFIRVLIGYLKNFLDLKKLPHLCRTCTIRTHPLTEAYRHLCIL